MTDGFIRKKVESLTLGEKLVKLRSQYRMSLTDISRATRIQVKYLEALESGDHHGLPAEVYVRGFLRSYARYLGLEDDAFIKLYDKEKHIRDHIGKEEKRSVPTSFTLRKAWVVTPKSIIFTGTVILLLGTFWYLFRELHAFVAEPHLVIMTPTAGQVVSEGVVDVIGRTDTGTQVLLNGESVFVDTEGKFQEKLILQPGVNVLKILATNRFEKTKEIILSVESSIAPAGLPPESVSVMLSAQEFVSQVLVEVDGVVVWNGPWEASKESLFEMKDRLKVKTDNASPFRLTVDGIDFPLDESAEGHGMEYGRVEFENIKNAQVSR